MRMLLFASSIGINKDFLTSCYFLTSTCTMKWYIQTLIILLSVFFYSSAFAAGDLDHFEVVLWKEEAKVWEALDITITATDKNSEIIEDYTGDILVFSESDTEAEFPNDLAENSYSFTTANEGSVKFENAVKFNNSWVQDIYVYDLNDENILWVAEITITEDVKVVDEEITILSPENGVTVWKNNITVSGRTQKNHQVRIIINETTDVFTTSNGEGIFEKDVSDLVDGANVFQAYVLNADSEKIGESEKVTVKINSKAPEFKSIKVNPTGNVESGSEISIEVISSAWLNSVETIINDVITKLEEGTDGIYRATTNAPKEAWEYGVDIVLKDEFAHETREREAETLIVTAAPVLNSGTPPKAPVVEEIPTEEPVATPKVLDLNITDIQVTELKTRSVVTWKEVPDARSYNVYKKIADNKIELIGNVQKPRFEIDIVGGEIKYEEFAIKALGQTTSGQVVQWDLSEMTKVKTGPEMYIFLFLVAMLLSSGIFFMRRTQA